MNAEFSCDNCCARAGGVGKGYSCKNHSSDIGGLKSGTFDSLSTSCVSHFNQAGLSIGTLTRYDAGALPNPFVRGVDRSGQLIIGHKIRRTVTADRQDSAGCVRGIGIQSWCGHVLPYAVMFWVWSAMNSWALSRSAGVLIATVLTPFIARRAIPVRVPPGNSSMMPVTPCSIIVVWHRSQRTGEVTWFMRR